MASFTPRLWIWWRTFWVAPVSSRNTVSVTSSSSRSGSSPAWVSAETRVTMKPGSRSWRGETLTAIEMSLGPGRRLAAGGAQHPFADPPEHAGLLGDRDELGRRDLAELGIVPAQQRLEALDLAGLGVDHRLVGEAELARVHRAVQRQLDLAALLGAGVQRRLVEADVVAAAVLGPVEREVGVADQLLDAVAVAAGRWRRRRWRRRTASARDRGTAPAAR